MSKLNTGYSVSILSEGMVRNIRSGKIFRTYQKGKKYGINAYKFVGETILNVNINNRTKSHTFLLQRTIYLNCWAGTGVRSMAYV